MHTARVSAQEPTLREALFGRLALAGNLLCSIDMLGIHALILIAAVESADSVPRETPERDTPNERWKKFSESEHHVAGSIIGASLATVAVVVPSLAVIMVTGIPHWFDDWDLCWDTSGSGRCPSRSPKPQPPLLSDSATYGLIVFALGSVTFVPYAAWLGHSLGKGKGDGKSAVIGSALGTALTVAFVLAASALTRESDGSASNTAATALLALAAVAPGTGAIIGLERSHASQAIPRVGFVPTAGGGKLSLAWKF